MFLDLFYGLRSEGVPVSIQEWKTLLRAVEEDQSFSLPPQKPNADCPVGQCIQAALEKVFVSAQTALIQELARTTLADIVAEVKAVCSRRKPGRK